MDSPTLSPTELWNRVFERVRRRVDEPMVWLAMQSAKPIIVDGNYFVVGLPPEKEYLADNLRTFEHATAIEDALRDIAGHILAFHLIEGETVEAWEAVKEREGIVPLAIPLPSTPPPPEAVQAGAQPPAGRDVSPTWEKLAERLQHNFRTAPYIKYPHGQARFVLETVKHVSDTMDVLMPGPGLPPDDQQERALSRTLERLSGNINLDPIFLALELYRYRQSQGK